jgi:CRP/FNR family transcriptional regulator
MANYCGVTRETISRKLTKFEELEIIKLEGTKVIVIKDEEALREYGK